MNKPTVQDIFRCFYPAYLEKYSPSPEQTKLRNILNCKTGASGANVSVWKTVVLFRFTIFLPQPLLSHVWLFPKERGWMPAERMLDAPTSTSAFDS